MACFDIPGDAKLSADRRTLLLTTGGERLAQRLRVGIKTIQGTYKYDLDKGVPWFELLQKPNQTRLRAGLRDFFLGFPEVASILSLEFEVNRSTRVMSCRYELRLADGTVVAATSPITPLA